MRCALQEPLLRLIVVLAVSLALSACGGSARPVPRSGCGKVLPDGYDAGDQRRHPTMQEVTGEATPPLTSTAGMQQPPT
jgi:hypothetical protein